MNELILFDLTIDDLEGEGGVSKMSLVSSPAVDKNFIALSKDNTRNHDVKFISLNREKCIVTGVALRADYPIYRKEDDREYYFSVSSEVIEKIMLKFMAEKRTDNVNIEHSIDTSGVFLYESYQLTEDLRNSKKEFSEIELGSWMVSYKVDNMSVWNLIKDGTINGFSVELFGVMNDNGKRMSKSSMSSSILTLLIN